MSITANFSWRSQSSQSYGVPAIILLALFIATNYTYSYSNAVVLGFSDVIDYVRIATTHREFDFYQLSQTIPVHRLERWPIHYLLGRFANASGIDIWNVYRSSVIICMLLVFLMIGRLNCKPAQKLAFFALVLLSPYAFRQYYAVPGMLSDCIFYTSIVGMSVGFSKRHLGWIGLSLLAACLARQTGAILIVVVALYCWVQGLKRIPSALVLVMGVSAFLSIRVFTELTFAPASNEYIAKHILGIYYWLIGLPQFGGGPRWSDLFQFLGRYCLMLLSISPLLILVYRLQDRKMWMYVLFFFMLHSQPLMGGPFISGSNVDRLAIYGLPFLAILLLNDDWEKHDLKIFMGLLFLESLLPQFSIFHGIPAGSYLFLAAVLVTSLISIKQWRSQRISHGMPSII